MENIFDKIQQKNAQRGNLILKAFGEGEILEKGGEGSRGGKVIGHTKSGKPIYEHSDNKNLHSYDHKGSFAAQDIMKEYKHFDSNEHIEAAESLSASKKGDKSIKSKERKEKLIRNHLTQSYIKQHGYPKDEPGKTNPMHDYVQKKMEELRSKNK